MLLLLLLLWCWWAPVLLLLSLALLPRLVPHCADWWHLAPHQEVHLQPATHIRGQQRHVAMLLVVWLPDLISGRVNTAMVTHCSARTDKLQTLPHECQRRIVTTRHTVSLHSAAQPHVTCAVGAAGPGLSCHTR